MKRHEIKPLKKNHPTQTSSNLRQEVDTYIRHIAQVVEKDPKKAAKIFEGWLDQSPRVEKKKRAA